MVMQETMSIQQRNGLYIIILGYFMVQFALVPIAAILPSLSREFGITMSESGWIMAIYLLSLTGLLLISGRLGDQFGNKQIFLVGTIIFLISSILCGFSTSYIQLVVFRALQGVGTALMSGNSLSIISKLFPEKSGRLRGHAFGKVTSAAAFGSLIGIVMGTLFLQYLSWRWIFWTTIPMAILILFMINNIKEEKKVIDIKKIDFSGGILLYLILVISIFYVSSIPNFGSCQEGAGILQAFSCTPYFIYITPIVLLSLVFLLIRTEKRVEYPIILLHEFKNKLFVTSIGANFILHLAMINVVFFVPFLIEGALGMAPLYVGFVLISVELMNAIFPRISGAIYARTKSNTIRPIGMGIILSGFMIYYFLIGATTITPYLIIGGWIGIGMGVFWSVNNNMIMNSIKGDYQGFASGMLETTRQLGHTFAASISAVAMTFGVIGTGLQVSHGHGSPTSDLLLEASTIFDGTRNVIVVSIILTAIGLYLSFFKEENSSVKETIYKNKKVN